MIQRAVCLKLSLCFSQAQVKTQVSRSWLCRVYELFSQSENLSFWFWAKPVTDSQVTHWAFLFLLSSPTFWAMLEQNPTTLRNYLKIWLSPRSDCVEVVSFSQMWELEPVRTCQVSQLRSDYVEVVSQRGVCLKLSLCFSHLRSPDPDCVESMSFSHKVRIWAFDFEPNLLQIARWPAELFCFYCPHLHFEPCLGEIQQLWEIFWKFD